MSIPRLIPAFAKTATGLLATLIVLGMPQSIFAANSIETIKHYGGEGGNPFPSSGYVPMITGTTIEVHTGEFVDSLIIDGIRYGGGGGVAKIALKLGSQEYINEVIVWHGEFVDHVEFKTNRGQSTGKREAPGGTKEVLSDIRLLGISGRGAEFLDKLTLTYRSNYSSYKEPQRLPAAAHFILTSTEPGSTYQETTDTKLSELKAYETIEKSSSSQNLSSEVEAEYAFIKAKISAEMTQSKEYTRTDKGELVHVSGKVTSVSRRNTDQEMSVETATGHFFKHNDGTYTVRLNGGTTWVKIPLNQDQYKGRLNGFYDITGSVAASLPFLNTAETDQGPGQDYIQIIGEKK